MLCLSVSRLRIGTFICVKASIGAGVLSALDERWILVFLRQYSVYDLVYSQLGRAIIR